MNALNATQVRNEWSAVVDSVIRERPAFIKRTRDYLFLSDIDVLDDVLFAYSFHAELLVEDNGSITISLDEIDLIENGADEKGAVGKMALAILDYSKDYYNDFAYWARGERRSHIPYVLKALVLDDAGKIGGLIECHRGGGQK